MVMELFLELSSILMEPFAPMFTATWGMAMGMCMGMGMSMGMRRSPSLYVWFLDTSVPPMDLDLFEQWAKIAQITKASPPVRLRPKIPNTL